MASLIKGTTITAATTVTAQTLADLIEDATISGLTPADVTGVIFTSVGSATPNASIYPFWYDPSQEDPVFRVFAAPWNIWLTIGPDRFEIPLQNASGTECLQGTQVIAAGASLFSIASQCSINAIGFLQARTAANAWGPVSTCGIGWTLFASSVSITSPDGGRPRGQDVICNFGCAAGAIAGYGADTADPSGPLFGMFLETDRTGSSGSFTAKRAFIWGPRLTEGF